jgi:hypothetical protein
MVRAIARFLIGALPLLAVVTAALAADDNATKAPSQPSPAPQANQTFGGFPPAPPMDGAPATRSLRKPAPAGPGGEGGRPDDTVGGLPGAKPSIPDKQP